VIEPNGQRPVGLPCPKSVAFSYSLIYVCNDHPVKMRPCLARAIVQIYGEPHVLDPMVGMGTTMVEAMLSRMDAVGVEYEKRFVDQANRNIARVPASLYRRTKTT